MVFSSAGCLDGTVYTFSWNSLWTSLFCLYYVGLHLFQKCRKPVQLHWELLCQLKLKLWPKYFTPTLVQKDIVKSPHLKNMKKIIKVFRQRHPFTRESQENMSISLECIIFFLWNRSGINLGKLNGERALGSFLQLYQMEEGSCNEGRRQLIYIFNAVVGADYFLYMPSKH